MRAEAIIVAGGIGERFNKNGHKQFYPLRGKPILWWTLKRFEDCRMIDKIIVIIPQGMRNYAKKIVPFSEYEKIKELIKGGEEREDSVLQGLKIVDEDTDIVVIHDGVRPLISPHLIEKVIYQTEKEEAVSLGVPVKETIKRVDENNLVVKTIKRENLYSIQTPQGFKRDIIWEAHIKKGNFKKKASDDALLVERLGKRVRIIPGDEKNIKITTSEDLKLAEVFLEEIDKCV
ncbi:MAG: 2-C-methyl-D-erythritol 4-phosphate cytidylyltransferase [Candidatus Aerophobetes bacterium]|nr:2-C-methyl-D-erythritol 4-phosphate cytidylyltransferase [Candidatus Aerophobetes bacterium]